MTEKLYGGKKRKQSKKSSACVGLKKKDCVFPCKKVRKAKGKSEFGHCQTVFSKKKKYLDADTQKVIYDGIKKGKRSEKKARRLRKKASETRKAERSASKKADKLEKKAETEESKANDFLKSVSTSLFGSSEEKAPESPEPVEDNTVEIASTEESAVVDSAPTKDNAASDNTVSENQPSKEEATVAESTDPVIDKSEKEGVQMNMSEVETEEIKKEEI